MAAGDFVVRRNASNTDEIPDAGTSLDLLWDTAVDNEGTGITYSSGTFTLGETGRFLVMASDQGGTTDTTANERTSWKMQFELDATVLNEGRSDSYVRRTGGSQEYITMSMAYVNVASTTGTGDELVVVSERYDNSTAGTVNRIADRSGVSILKLSDSWNFAHYRSSATVTTSTTDNVSVTANIGTTVEEDGTVFSRTSNTVTIDTANPVLVLYTHYVNDASVTGRSEYQSSITFDSAELVRGVGQFYGPRASDNCDEGAWCSSTIIYPDDTGQALTLNIISRESGGETFSTELQLIELPSGAETATVTRTTAAGNHNKPGEEFIWQSTVNVDTAAFTHTAGNSNIDVDNAGDYLALANLGNFADGGHNGTRAVPAQQFRVNTTNQSHAGGSSFNREFGTANHGHEFVAGLLPGLAANDSVSIWSDRIGTATTVMTAVGGFSLVRLSSLFSGGTLHERTATVAVSVATGGTTMQRTAKGSSTIASLVTLGGTTMQRTAKGIGSAALSVALAATGKKPAFERTASSALSVTLGGTTMQRTAKGQSAFAANVALGGTTMQRTAKGQGSSAVTITVSGTGISSAQRDTGFPFWAGTIPGKYKQNVKKFWRDRKSREATIREV